MRVHEAKTETEVNAISIWRIYHSTVIESCRKVNFRRKIFT